MTDPRRGADRPADDLWTAVRRSPAEASLRARRPARRRCCERSDLDRARGRGRRHRRREPAQARGPSDLAGAGVAAGGRHRLGEPPRRPRRRPVGPRPASHRPAARSARPGAAPAHRRARCAGPAAVIAPLTGIFYASPRPAPRRSSPSGAEVVVGQVIGLIEAMKLFNEIKSDQAGRVVRVVAADGALVKAKQPLIEVEPL